MMTGFGTIINAAAIAGGAGVGLLFKKGLPERFNHTVTSSVALAVTLIGITGVCAGVLRISADGGMERVDIMLMVLCLVLGGIIGELLRLDDRFASLANLLTRRFAKGGASSTFTQGFIDASILFCVGAMSVVGAIEDALLHKYDVLLAKSALDGFTSIILASRMGAGVGLSAVCVLIYQGGITLLAGLLQDVLTATALTQMSMIGSALILVIGLNMFGMTKIKVMNLLPATFLPIIWDIIIHL